MSFSHVMATVLLVAGTLLDVFAVLGMVVMRSAYDRLHYVGLGGYGAVLIAVAILVRESFSLIANKALAAAFLLVSIGPVLVHATARSLRTRERGEWRQGIEAEAEPGP